MCLILLFCCSNPQIFPLCSDPSASLGTPWTSGRCGATSRIRASFVTFVTAASPSTWPPRRRMPLCRARIVSRSMSSNQVKHGDFFMMQLLIFYGILLMNNMKMEMWASGDSMETLFLWSLNRPWCWEPERTCVWIANYSWLMNHLPTGNGCPSSKSPKLVCHAFIFHCWPDCRYPTNKTIEHHHFYRGKLTVYKWRFSIAMLNYQRVYWTIELFLMLPSSRKFHITEEDQIAKMGWDQVQFMIRLPIIWWPVLVMYRLYLHIQQKYCYVIWISNILWFTPTSYVLYLQ